MAVTTWKRVKTVRWQEANGCAVAVSHLLPLKHPSRAQVILSLRIIYFSAGVPLIASHSSASCPFFLCFCLDFEHGLT